MISFQREEDLILTVLAKVDSGARARRNGSKAIEKAISLPIGFEILLRSALLNA